MNKPTLEELIFLGLIWEYFYKIILNNTIAADTWFLAVPVRNLQAMVLIMYGVEKWKWKCFLKTI